jgi:ribosomal RNA-processing protein 17
MVTVVEDFDVHFFGPNEAKRRPQTMKGDLDTIPKRPKDNSQKPKKILYQTKEARKKERLKQRARRIEKAELAGRKKNRSASK